MKLMLKIAMVGLSAAILGAGALTLSSQTATTAYAQAQSAKTLVDAAKAEGKVGESIVKDSAGYLVVVNNQTLDPATSSAMREINIGRKTLYTRLARDQGVKVEDVAALTGEKLVSETPRGQFVLTTNGWMRK